VAVLLIGELAGLSRHCASGFELWLLNDEVVTTEWGSITAARCDNDRRTACTVAIIVGGAAIILRRIESPDENSPAGWRGSATIRTSHSAPYDLRRFGNTAPRRGAHSDRVTRDSQGPALGLCCSAGAMTQCSAGVSLGLPTTDPAKASAQRCAPTRRHGSRRAGTCQPEPWMRLRRWPIQL
jgi:hypothetical protein